MLSRRENIFLALMLLAFQTIIIVGQNQYDLLMSGHREFFPADVMSMKARAVIPCVAILLVCFRRFIGAKFTVAVCVVCGILPALVLWEIIGVVTFPF